MNEAAAWLLSKVGPSQTDVFVPDPDGALAPMARSEQWVLDSASSCRVTITRRTFATNPSTGELGAFLVEDYSFDLSRVDPASCHTEGNLAVCRERDGGSLGTGTARGYYETPVGGIIPASDAAWRAAVGSGSPFTTNPQADVHLGPAIGSVGADRVVNALRDLVTACGGGGPTERY
jgi:hypothetical protein